MQPGWFSFPETLSQPFDAFPWTEMVSFIEPPGRSDLRSLMFRLSALMCLRSLTASAPGIKTVPSYLAPPRSRSRPNLVRPSGFLPLRPRIRARSGLDGQGREIGLEQEDGPWRLGDGEVGVSGRVRQW